MKLFPYTLARRTAIPWNTINDRERLEALSIQVKYFQHLSDSIAHQQFLVADMLLQEIKKREESEIKKQLIKLRRNIFNGRNVSDRQAELVEEVLCEEDLHIWLMYRQTKHGIEQSKQIIAQQFEVSLFSTRSNIQKKSMDERLLKGLNFSVDDFLRRIKRYAETEIKDFRKKELNIEKGVIKYLTRIGFKTSPFSTFTNVSFQPLEQAKENSGIPSSPAVRSVVKLNTLLFKSIQDIFSSYAPIKDQLTIELNPSIQSTEECFVFVLNINEIESVQQLASNPILKFVEKELSTRAYSFATLVTKIADCTAESRNDCELYLNNLISVGFLELKTGISGIDPVWDTKLLRFLEMRELRDDQITSKLKEVLLYLDDSKQQLAEGNHLERDKVLRESHVIIKSFFDDYNAKIQSEKERTPSYIESQVFFSKSSVTRFNLAWNKIFYEDTYFDSPKLFTSTAVQEIITLIDGLSKYALSLQYDIEYERLKRFFLDKYGANEVSVLKLYQDYSEEVLKEIERFEKKKEEEEPPPYYAIPVIEERRTMRQKWDKVVRTKMDVIASGEVNISQVQLDDAFEECGLKKYERTNESLALFTQLFKKKNGTYLAFVKSPTMGYGKFFSRFLDHSSEEIWEAQRSQNRMNLDANLLHVENTGPTFFNANIHPPLLDLELKSPGNHNFLPTTQQVRVANLVVKTDSKGELTLVEKEENKPVRIYDLCFQSPTSRSKLFQLLNNFSPIKYVNFYSILAPINHHFELSATKFAEQGYIFFPRVMYENKIVLQRKFWKFSIDHIPQRKPQDSNVDYFLALKHWQKHHKIPEEVFIYLNTDRNKKRSNQSKLTRDDYKPQYIDFNNPSLCLFFEKIIRKVDTSLKIEEMLPNSQQSRAFSNSYHIYEYLFQWH